MGAAAAGPGGVVSRASVYAVGVLAGGVAVIVGATVAGNEPTKAPTSVTSTPTQRARTTPIAVPTTVPGPPVPSTSGCVVRRVVDGDTVDVDCGAGKVRVRVIGIDTPETVDPRKPVQCYGPEASAQAKKLLPVGAAVQVTADPSQGRTDKYGRTLAYLSVGGRDYGLQMIQGGWAREYTYDTVYAKSSRYKRAEHVAEARKVGLWGSC